ncbi:MAG: DUF1415 domain-containing protein [Planctomycetota bacterium]
MGTFPKDDVVIAVTEKWVMSVVVEHDFCPFARRELERGSVRFRVLGGATPEECCVALLDELRKMGSDESIETTFLILSTGQEEFEEYLMLVGAAEACLESAGYEGVYQLASFHPDYCFVDSSPDDAANYTNRSPYPMIHILRASSVEQAIVQHLDPEGIPERNIEVARKLGVETMKGLRDQCWFDDAGNRLDG